jgi:hypothetical protein
MQKHRANDLEGCRVLISSGSHAGGEGICLGKSRDGKWAVSPDSNEEILTLEFEKDFGLLVDLSANPERN